MTSLCLVKKKSSAKVDPRKILVLGLKIFRRRPGAKGLLPSKMCGHQGCTVLAVLTNPSAALCPQKEFRK